MTQCGLWCVYFALMACAMPMAAQPSQRNSPSTGAPLGGTIHLQDSRGRIPALVPKLLGDPLKVNPNRVVLKIRRLNGRELSRLGSQPKPKLLAGVDVTQIQARLDALMAQAKLQAMMQQPTICYAMRGYQMEQIEAGSDATRWKGSSNCMPAAQVHTKTIVK